MTPSKEELSGLIERVRGLKGADRATDRLIQEHIVGTQFRSGKRGREWLLDSHGGVQTWSRHPTPFTGSVDAIRALTEKLLDGEDGRPLLYGRASEWAAMALPEHQCAETLNFAVGEAPSLQMITVSERAETECAAAILALLLSLQSQEPTL